MLRVRPASVTPRVSTGHSRAIASVALRSSGARDRHDRGVANPIVDLFVHDSLHTEYNTCFELEQAWTALRPGGAVVVDDIDLNWGFHSFIQAHPDDPFLICRSSPLQVDPSRFDGSGLFGIVVKLSSGPPHNRAR